MQLTFLGSGDAFASGGRFNTCLHLKGGSDQALIDCGASSMIAMRRNDVTPENISTIFITHFHGDHFGGVPFFLLEAQLGSRREQHLTIAGPPGIEKAVRHLGEALFPGFNDNQTRFPLEFVDLAAEQSVALGAFTVTGFEVAHSEKIPAPCYALRVEHDDRIVTYSGDTAWCDGLKAAAKGADLFVCEAYMYDRAVPGHNDFMTLSKHLGEIEAKRIVLTHMSSEMLVRRHELGYETSEDGLAITL